MGLDSSGRGDGHGRPFAAARTPCGGGWRVGGQFGSDARGSGVARGTQGVPAVFRRAREVARAGSGRNPAGAGFLRWAAGGAVDRVPERERSAVSGAGIRHAVAGIGLRRAQKTGDWRQFCR